MSDPQPTPPTMFEFVAMLDELEAAGLLESFERADGRVARRLTGLGQQVARTRELAGEAAADVVLEGLLCAARAVCGSRTRPSDRSGSGRPHAGSGTGDR